MGGISLWQLLIILLIVLLLFGTKKLRNIGGDLGSGLKNFRDSMKDEKDNKPDEQQQQKEDINDSEKKGD